MSLNKGKYNRIIDANFNRAKEGMRVCEDICRYQLNARTLTKSWKDLRHELTRLISTSDVIADRNVNGDVGAASSPSEMKRTSLKDIYLANAQRVKESLRVLEELAKLTDTKSAQLFKQMRYDVYAVEKKSFTKL